MRRNFFAFGILCFFSSMTTFGAETGQNPEWLYEENTVKSENADWNTVFASLIGQNVTGKFDRLGMTILGQPYFYALTDRPLRNLIREINMDLLTHVFLNPQLKSSGHKIYVDLRFNRLSLFAESLNNSNTNEGPTLVELCDYLKSSSDFINKVTQFAKTRWNIECVFPNYFYLPQLDKFDDLKELSKDNIEKMVSYYVDMLAELSKASPPEGAVVKDIRLR